MYKVNTLFFLSINVVQSLGTSNEYKTHSNQVYRLLLMPAVYLVVETAKDFENH